MLIYVPNLLILSTVAVVSALRPARYNTRDITGIGSEYSSIVVFGDSFSDNGDGAYRISNGTWPRVPPYYQGRFSNGPVWPEYLSANLSLPLYDYATGGATTANTLIQGFTGPNSTIAVPSVADQVSSFLAGISPQGNNNHNNNASSSSSSSSSSLPPLFIIWAGANDIFFNPNISAAQSYLEIAAVISTLFDTYPDARIITVASPDISRLPYGFYIDEVTKTQLRSFTDLLAALLESGASSSSGGGNGHGNGNRRIDNVDLRGLFNEFEYFALPQTYGFAPLGKYGSCLVGAYGEGGYNVTTQCGDAEKMVYWDEYHPTTHTHSWITRVILDALN